MSDEKKIEVVPFVPAADPTGVRVVVQTGSFNILDSSDVSTQVGIQVYFADETSMYVYTTFPQGDAPISSDDELWPSELIDTLLNKINKAWILTSRKEDRGKLEWIRENSILCDLLFNQGHERRVVDRIEKLEKKRSMFQNNIKGLLEELAETPHA